MSKKEIKAEAAILLLLSGMCLGLSLWSFMTSKLQSGITSLIMTVVVAFCAWCADHKENR